eukprot:TRINITY_DN32795_c0_g1_i1.p1 TRINITY_DN32795_c0_g1~~TRINITY_DN32795_c0_g1_i1.p1  ORF type:complete len:803 (+),score=294.74 TRINITY_DN32795_c0_g1_i1:98-2506(+)
MEDGGGEGRPPPTGMRKKEMKKDMKNIKSLNFDMLNASASSGGNATAAPPTAAATPKSILGSPHRASMGAEDINQGSLKLNPMQLRQCERLFATFDEDGSGTIDHAELKDAMSCMGAILNDEDIAVLLKNIDLDQSGTIDIDEFILFVILYKETCRLHMLHMPLDLRSQLETAWQTAYLFPDSPRMWIAQVVIVSVTLYYFVAVSYYAAIQQELPVAVAAANGVVGVIYLADLGRCLFTVDPSHHQVTTQLSHEDLAESRGHYLRGWFAVDLLAALPLDVVVYLITAALGSSTFPALYCAGLRLTKLLKINYMFQRSKRPVLTRFYVKYYFYYVPLMLRIFWWLIIVHTLACCWLVISPDDTYSTASYWVLYSITTVGYGDIPHDTDAKRALAIVLCIGGLLGNGVLVGMLTLEMEKLSSQSETKNIMVETHSLLQHLNIPRGLQEQIFAFQHHQLSHSLTAGAVGVVDTLPPTIQENVDLFLKCKFLAGVDFFDDVPEDCRLTIAACFAQMVHPPGDIILPEGAELQNVLFITHGIVEMVVEGLRKSLLQRGDMFGVNALIGGQRAEETARAVTYVETFVLNRADILCAMKIYPEFKDLVARRLQPSDEEPPSSPTHQSGSPRACEDAPCSPKRAASMAARPPVTPRMVLSGADEEDSPRAQSPLLTVTTARASTATQSSFRAPRRASLVAAQQRGSGAAQSSAPSSGGAGMDAAQNSADPLRLLRAKAAAAKRPPQCRVRRVMTARMQKVAARACRKALREEFDRAKETLVPLLAHGTAAPLKASKTSSSSATLSMHHSE